MTAKQLEEILKRPENKTVLMEIFNDWIWNNEIKNISLFPMEEISDHVDGNIGYFWKMFKAAEHFDYSDKYCLKTESSLESSDYMVLLIEGWSLGTCYAISEWLIKEKMLDQYWIEGLGI